MEFYPHQSKALKDSENLNRVAYYWDMGLGKTFVGGEKLVSMGEAVNLIVCQKSKIEDWIEHFKLHYEKSDRLMKLEVGRKVTVLEELGNWNKISYEGTYGYMMSKFLLPVTAKSDDSSDVVTFTLPRSIANKLYDSLGAGLGYGVG